MPCRRPDEEKLLHAFGEGTSDFKKHLAVCADCAQDIAQIEEVRRIYRSEPPAAPLPLRVRRTPLFASWIAVAAAFLVVLLGRSLTVPLPAAPVAPAAQEWLSSPDLDSEIATVRARLVKLAIEDDEF